MNKGATVPSIMLSDAGPRGAVLFPLLISYKHASSQTVTVWILPMRSIPLLVDFSYVIHRISSWFPKVYRTRCMLDALRFPSTSSASSVVGKV